MKNFVEIGACDFDNLDNYLDINNTVFFVEPVPAYYKSLISKVGKKRNAVFDNCAISSFNGKTNITFIEPDTAEQQWVRGISHLDFSSSNLILKNKNLGYNIGTPKSVNVRCFTLDYFFYRHGIRNVEYLKMDVEGHELEILKAFSWRIKPQRLKIEHKFVNVDELTGMLSEQGYTNIIIGDDVYATL